MGIALIVPAESARFLALDLGLTLRCHCRKTIARKGWCLSGWPPLRCRIGRKATLIRVDRQGPADRREGATRKGRLLTGLASRANRDDSRRVAEIEPHKISRPACRRSRPRWIEKVLTRTNTPEPVVQWGRQCITANGLSSSRPRESSDGAEDPDASRRVEFRVLMKAKEQLLQIVEPGAK